MANWTSNRLNVIGAPHRVDALLRALIPADADASSIIDSIPCDESSMLPFTFQGIVPRPQVLEDTTAMGDVALGLAVLSDAKMDWVRVLEESDPIKPFLPPDMIETRTGILRRYDLEGLSGQDLLAAADCVSPGCVERGRASIRAYQETGYLDWYLWSQEHWGVKWDVSEARYQMTGNDGVTILFDVANGSPLPFLRKLVEAFPDLHIHGACVEPGNGIADIFKSENGVLIERERATVDDAYMEVFGEPYPDDDDDIEPSGPTGPR
jgi:hypothetical protein